MTNFERVLVQDYTVLDEITLDELLAMEPLCESATDNQKYIYSLMVEMKNYIDLGNDEIDQLAEDFKRLSKLPHIKKLFDDNDWTKK
jgi:hypothetical protein